MNVKHHPSDEILFDYASGALHEAWSLAVASHLAFCPTCRHHVATLETMGGALLDDDSAVDLEVAQSSDDAFADLMRAIDAPQPIVAAKPETVPSKQTLPTVLRHYVGCDLDDIHWKRVGPGAHQFIVPTAEQGVIARLLKIAPGSPVPEHTHQGFEMTLVLSGSFEDHTGHFGAGDLEEADETVEHQPIAGADEACICLAVTDAPLRFRSLAARVVQPFVGI